MISGKGAHSLCILPGVSTLLVVSKHRGVHALFCFTYEHTAAASFGLQKSSWYGIFFLISLKDFDLRKFPTRDAPDSINYFKSKVFVLK
jgi:hypothetical protein